MSIFSSYQDLLGSAKFYVPKTNVDPKYHGNERKIEESECDEKYTIEVSDINTKGGRQNLHNRLRTMDSI